MRLERRIREGAERNAAVLEPNVEGSFSTVVREARRRRRVRLTLSSLVTMSLIAAAIVVGPGILDGLASNPDPAMATQPTQVATPDPSSGRRHAGDVRQDHLARTRRGPRERAGGYVEHRHRRPTAGCGCSPPRGSPVPRGSWPLDARTNEFRTSAFSNGLCAGQLAGTYRWTRISRYLILDMVRDHCDARVWLLTSGPWMRS